MRRILVKWNMVFIEIINRKETLLRSIKAEKAHDPYTPPVMTSSLLFPGSPRNWRRDGLGPIHCTAGQPFDPLHCEAVTCAQRRGVNLAKSQHTVTIFGTHALGYTHFNTE